MNKMKHVYRIGSILLLVGINVGCDQVSKNIAREKLTYYEHVSVISDLFILTKVENTGAFLGAGSDMSPLLKDTLLLGLPTLLLLGMLAFIIYRTQLTKTYTVALTMIIGGGIGNMIDRMLYGSVTDFLHIDLGLLKTGIFNMADVSVTIGVIYLLIFSLTPGKPEITPR